MVKQKRKTGSKLEKEMSVIESAKIKILEAERRQLESLVGELKVENSNIRGRLQQLESQYYDLTHASDIIKLENKTLSEETERLNLALRQSNAQRDNLLMLSDEQNVKIVELQRLVTILQTADIRQVQEQAISDIRHLQSKIEANDRIMQQRIKEKDDLLADISNQLNAVKKENEILKDSLHNSTFMTQIDLSRSSGGDSRGYESSQEQLIDNNVVDDAYLSGVLGLSESLHEEVNDLTAQVAKEQSPYSHRGMY